MMDDFDDEDDDFLSSVCLDETVPSLRSKDLDQQASEVKYTSGSTLQMYGDMKSNGTGIYSRTSMARTLMARLPWLFRTRS